MSGLSIGKPAPEDISSESVRFPIVGETAAWGWLQEIVRPYGGRIGYSAVRGSFLAVPVRAGSSLQSLAAVAQRIVSEVNRRAEAEDRGHQAQAEDDRRPDEAPSVRAEELRAQLDDLQM